MNKLLILNEIKSYLNIKSDTEFAVFLGIKPQVLSNWKARNTFDIDLIYTKCEFIDANWLLTGQGEMLKNIPAPEPAPQESHAGADELVTLLRDKIALLEKNNTLLEKNNALLEDKIEDLKRRLEFAEVKDKEEMSLKIKKQRKENKTIIAEKNEIIFAQSEEINALKSRHLPPDKPLRPAQKL